MSSLLLTSFYAKTLMHEDRVIPYCVIQYHIIDKPSLDECAVSALLHNLSYIMSCLQQVIKGANENRGFSSTAMKFTSLLVFTLSSANAEKEPTVLQFLPVPHIFPPMYRIRAELLSSRTSHEIVLRTDSPDLFAYYSQRTRGVVNYEKLPNGQYNVVINDNDAKGGDEPFRIDLIRSGEEFHYEGTSVTYKWIDDVKGYGNVRAIDDDGLRYGHPRFYRN